MCLPVNQDSTRIDPFRNSGRVIFSGKYSAGDYLASQKGCQIIFKIFCEKVGEEET